MARFPTPNDLPHADPFRFVDRVTDYEAGVRAVGIRTFLPEDPIFRGHFPGEPIVPGVLLAEALAQVAGLAIGSGQRLLLSSIRKMNFPSAAGPGEEITLEASLEGTLGHSYLFACRASVGGRIVASGQITLSGTS